MAGNVILAATALATGGENGAFSPQHVNNWTLRLYGATFGGKRIFDGTDPLSFSLARAFLPTVGVDDVEIPFGNESVHVAGRAKFEGGTVEVRDYVDKDIQEYLINWFGLVYNGPVYGGKWGLVGQPKAYKRVGEIIMSAPDGEEERSWHLEGIWPVSGNFGALDMASSEQVMVAFTVRYDRARYNGKRVSAEGSS